MSIIAASFIHKSSRKGFGVLAQSLMLMKIITLMVSSYASPVKKIRHLGTLTTGVHAHFFEISSFLITPLSEYNL
jgi:hypothetical protein